MIISLRTLRSEWLAALLLLISVLAGQMWAAWDADSALPWGGGGGVARSDLCRELLRAEP